MQLEVGYLGTINSKAMTFEVHLTLRHWWKDSRLEFNRSLGEDVVGQLSLRNSIWTPTLFFHNEKESELVQTTKDNVYVKVGSNGEVYMAVRFRLTLSCPMNLVNYPMDTQHCSIFIMSWFYDVSMLILKWKDHEKCLILPSFSLPEHFLDSSSITCDDKVTSYSTLGNYSGLKALFTLEREFKYYMIEVYVPVMLLVIVSWISFWLDIHAVPARVALGITTILTVITNSRGVKDSIPRVSYIKAVDVWYLSCTLLVFFAFLEFPLVNFIARKARSKMAAQMTNSGNQNSSDQNPNRIFQVCEGIEC
ncbi:glutamate-gated chloride channel-like [Tachypleus tridentatus]|uniref:glutamate-gated chloride channel-like n=1 Tax=Tachypleus tridentatus TaxID=6853 RepID=UPI003FD2649A